MLSGRGSQASPVKEVSLPTAHRGSVMLSEYAGPPPRKPNSRRDVVELPMTYDAVLRRSQVSTLSTDPTAVTLTPAAGDADNHTPERPEFPGATITSTPCAAIRDAAMPQGAVAHPW